ncbi:hypothetical protein FB45DRAFT_890086 [Roridomyces roridus]|uniref:Uncharacterized protein n=1 Tax=Roridomyces roridus TaxID=1738132 RepID=A0AAD7CKT3_9AGAR|nr:hypothetical protein FB45DRAFT_890086 [Roridomyces roridus]
MYAQSSDPVGTLTLELFARENFDLTRASHRSHIANTTHPWNELFPLALDALPWDTHPAGSTTMWLVPHATSGACPVSTLQSHIQSTSRFACVCDAQLQLRSLPRGSQRDRLERSGERLGWGARRSAGCAGGGICGRCLGSIIGREFSRYLLSGPLCVRIRCSGRISSRCAVPLAVSSCPPRVHCGSGFSWAARKFSEGMIQIEDAILQEKAWYVVAINFRASVKLAGAVSAVDATHASSKVITSTGAEARNENSFRVHQAIASAQLDATTEFALQPIANLSSFAVVKTSPPSVLEPVTTLSNTQSFDVLSLPSASSSWPSFRALRSSAPTRFRASEPARSFIRIRLRTSA